MEYYYIFLVLISCFSYIHAQKFTEESPYLIIRLMDVKVNEWKPWMLDELEKKLDAELKYTDEKKGVRCSSIDFEQEAGYPKQEARFLDLSIRGLCKDDYGKLHNIEKQLMIDAIKQNLPAFKQVTTGTVFSVGNVQLYERDTGKLNWIIIPISVGLTVFLFVMTFVLRTLRRAQKKRHILSELEKKTAAAKKTPTVPNPDPDATENQRLLQLDANVVGNASNTLGSPKAFTNDQNSNPSRTNPPTTESRGGAKASTPPKDNQPVYYNQRERANLPYENETVLLPSHSQPQYDPRFPDMIPLQEQQPRVVVRTIHEDGNQPQYYDQNDERAKRFVPIPVQVERSTQQKYVPPPYHSDPYYRSNNV